jgi:type VI secretion system (T6SS) effector TldE1-like protein
MTDTTATFYNVATAHGRVFPFGTYRRVVNGVVIGLGTVTAVCVLVIIVTVAAAWIINNALATNRYIPVHAPLGSGTMALAKYGPTLASAADVSQSARISTAPADAPDVTFEAKWARAMTFARVSAVPLLSEHPLNRSNNVPAKFEKADAPNVTRVATLTPAAAPASPFPSTLPPPRKLTPEWSNTVPLPQPHPSKHEIARSPVGQAAAEVAAATPPPPGSTAEKRATSQQVYNKSMSPHPDSRIAIYDISARTVYLPSGEKLEAHSGLGDKLDDPQYVHVRMWGPTPPNVYDLTLRETLFHGVRAIRLNPVDDSQMYGRVGMLAHPYMLGPNGQSNGCVSFKDYPKFLQAFLNGEVDRLVVVPDLGTEPLRTARARRGNVGQYAFNNR